MNAFLVWVLVAPVFASPPRTEQTALQATDDGNVVTMPGLSIRNVRHSHRSPASTTGTQEVVGASGMSSLLEVVEAEVEARSAPEEAMSNIFFQVNAETSHNSQATTLIEVNAAAAGIAIKAGNAAQGGTSAHHGAPSTATASAGVSTDASSGVPGSLAGSAAAASDVVAVPKQGPPPAAATGGVQQGHQAAAAGNTGPTAAVRTEDVPPAGVFFQLSSDSTGNVEETSVPEQVVEEVDGAKRRKASPLVEKATRKAEDVELQGSAGDDDNGTGNGKKVSMMRRDDRPRGNSASSGLSTVGDMLRELLLPRRLGDQGQAEIGSLSAPGFIALLLVCTLLGGLRSARVATAYLTPTAKPLLSAQGAAPGKAAKGQQMEEKAILRTATSSLYISEPVPKDASSTGDKSSPGSASGLRARVSALQPCSAADIALRLPAGGSYDCALLRPVSSHRLLKLQARVEGPAAGAPLVAPLTRQACVLYSAAASRQLHDGVHPVTVAFDAAHVDFFVTLADDPNVRVEVLGAELSLFDMVSGRTEKVTPFPCAPDHWQDFVSTHQSTVMGADCSIAALRAEGAALEFQECALLIGSKVTLVGELLRGPMGDLSLQPLRQRKAGPSAELPPVPDVVDEVRFDKVLASDDPLLLLPTGPSGRPGALGVEGPTLAE